MLNGTPSSHGPPPGRPAGWSRTTRHQQPHLTSVTHQPEYSTPSPAARRCPGRAVPGMRLVDRGTRIGLDKSSPRGTVNRPPPAPGPGGEPAATNAEGKILVAVGRQRFSIISDGLPTQLPDIDPGETKEWVDSFDGVVRTRGRARARYVMLRLLERAREQQVGVPGLRSTDYINTIPPEREPWFPGDEYVERRIRAYIRWNAAVMVSRANRPGLGVGGHIATYASAASLYEVGFNHFFRGKDHGESGDQVFFQGHAAPGIYARAFLEGRLTEHQLNGFRQ